jgi:hypothetical protein
MPNKTINFAARFEYIGALEVDWPQVMTSLQEKVLPVYRRCLESRGESLALQTLVGLSDALGRGASPELQQVALAVRTWAEEHGFRDAWLEDVAVQSMHSWAHGGAESKWTYFPEDLVIPKFQVDFGHWFPVRGFTGYAEWPQFKGGADRKYRRERAAYRARVRKVWGVGYSKLGQHAVWTVLWQRGRSPEAIQLKHFRTTRQKVSDSNISKCVHEFAAAAGLSLRVNKRGVPRNTTSR